MTTLRNATQMQPAKTIHSFPLQVLSSLSLNLVREVEVAFVELMYSDIAIFSSGSIALSLGVDCNGILIFYVSDLL